MSEQQVVPMIHVPDTDVRATVDWYQSIGFAVLNTFEDDGEMNFALLSYGNSQIMITGGGRPSTEDRREMDLYIHTDDVERLFANSRTAWKSAWALTTPFMERASSSSAIPTAFG